MKRYKSKEQIEAINEKLASHKALKQFCKDCVEEGECSIPELFTELGMTTCGGNCKHCTDEDCVMYDSSWIG